MNGSRPGSSSGKRSSILAAKDYSSQGHELVPGDAVAEPMSPQFSRQQMAERAQRRQIGGTQSAPATEGKSIMNSSHSRSTFEEVPDVKMSVIGGNAATASVVRT